MKFKDNLKKIIQQRGLKLSDISRATGIPKSTLSEWTAGREPKISEPVLRLAKYLDVSLEYLFTGEEISSRESLRERLSIKFHLDGSEYLLKLIQLTGHK